MRHTHSHDFLQFLPDFLCLELELLLGAHKFFQVPVDLGWVFHSSSAQWHHKPASLFHQNSNPPISWKPQGSTSHDSTKTTIKNVCILATKIIPRHCLEPKYPKPLSPFYLKIRVPCTPFYMKFRLPWTQPSQNPSGLFSFFSKWSHRPSQLLCSQVNLEWYLCFVHILQSHRKTRLFDVHF